MLKTGLITLIIATVISAMSIYIYNRTSLDLSVRPASGDFFPKETVRVEATLRNTGLSGRYFFIDTKSDLHSFLPQVVYLKSRDSHSSLFTLTVPTGTTAGEYYVTVAVKTLRFMPFGDKSKPETAAEKRIAVRVKEPPVEVKVVEVPKKIVKVEKPPEPITGNLKFVSFPEELKYSILTQVILSVENTSSRQARFLVQLNLAGPDGGVKTFSKELELSSAAVESLPFEFILEAAELPGQYFATAELREMPANRLVNSDSIVSQLVDLPPKVELRDFILSPMEKHRYEIIANVSDDTGVTAVEMNYKDLARNYTTSYHMNMIHGNAYRGLWSCSFIPYKKTKDFRFSIDAHDIRNNFTRTADESSTDFLLKSFIGKVK